MNTKEYKNIRAFHPGAHIENIIESMDITQEEFAKRADTTAKNISDLVNGKQNLSKEMALKLSKLTGMSLKFWLNVQANYDKKILEIEELKKLDEEKEIAKQIKYDYFMVNYDQPKLSGDIAGKIKKIKKLLEISNLNTLCKMDFLTTYRNTSMEFNEKKIINSNIMLNLALLEARDKKDSIKNFDLKKLRESVKTIRTMTVKNPSVFLPELIEIFNDCGIVFVILPHLQGAGINGAVKKISPSTDKVMLMLNDRNKRADIFWFSLFHEIGHILNGDFEISLEGYNSDSNKKSEKNADLFAREVLIPQEDYELFLMQKNEFNEKNIKEFSNKIGIHPGIVVGRLQNDKLIGYHKFQNLKENYIIKKSQ